MPLSFGHERIVVIWRLKIRGAGRRCNDTMKIQKNVPVLPDLVSAGLGPWLTLTLSVQAQPVSCDPIRIRVAPGLSYLRTNEFLPPPADRIALAVARSSNDASHTDTGPNGRQNWTEGLFFLVQTIHCRQRRVAWRRVL
jgi:hypothetical protein